MNNQIKFKAWDKDNKIIVPVTRLEYVDGKLIKIGILFEGHKVESLRYPASVELMQYTGLKDFKGIEIYKGYILNCIAPGENRKVDSKIGNIIWRRVEARWELKQDVCLPLNWYTILEVIGNIYENKDLLTNNK